MMRRCVAVIAMTAVVSVAGCGAMMLAVSEGEPFWLLHRVNRPFVQPSHRVALATYEVLKAELTSVEIDDEEMTPDDQFDKPGGKTPMPGEIEIPDDVPAFWLKVLNFGPAIVNLRTCELMGKDRHGREVFAVVRIGSRGPKLNTVVSIQIGRRGDEKASRALLDKIAERVAHPSYKPGSPEERQALQDLFNPEPGEANGKARAFDKVELRLRKN